MSIDDRTTKALGPDVMKQLKTLHFCIVGCGGTGANFAEMLVRTGATRLTLIDGTEVKESGLNRVSSYCKSDCGHQKVKALKERLEAIRTDVDVRTLPDSFRAQDDILSDYPKGQCVRDAVYNADVVFIGTDTNRSRIAIEELCRAKTGRRYLSCGILVDQKKGVFEFECAWLRPTPPECVDDEGYGPDNASFASIVHEATSVAFTMLISHLKCEDSDFKYCRRRYDSCFRPVTIPKNERSSGNIP